MSILKSRPKIGLLVANEIVAGRDLPATVVLRCRRPVEVEYVEVVVEGTERWALPHGEATRINRQTILWCEARLCEQRLFSTGDTELPLRIPLPPETPPSFHGRYVRIDYELRVEAAIDWWPNARSAFQLHVLPPPLPSPPANPQVYSSNPEGPRGREPHVELSLSSEWTRVGASVQGAFALSNVAFNRYSDVSIGLRGIEHTYGAPVVQHEHRRFRIRVGAERAREGEMIPFAFRVPPDTMPDLPRVPRPHGRAPIIGLSWQLELVVGVRWGTDLTVRVPFQLLSASADPADAPLRLAPPMVGIDRAQALWTAVGAPHGLRYDAQALHGRYGETALTVRRGHGKSAVVLIAELAYPELYLDLVVEPVSGLLGALLSDVEIGDPSWDREHHVVARDGEQAAEVLRALLAALAGTELRRLDDRALAVEQRYGRESRRGLARFTAAAVELAQHFEALRRELPPPTKMRSVLAEWRALESVLHAPLETARMRVAGRLGMHEAEVRVAFDRAGEPMSTWLSVVTPAPLDEEHRFRWQASEGPLAPRLRGELADLVGALTQRADELHIEPDRIALALPAPLGLADEHGQLVEVAIAERRLEQMVRVVAILTAQAGPYR